MDKKTIAQNFSRVAHLYDKHADIQRQAAYELLSRVSRNGFCHILEIGCGTGIYTALLRQKFDVASLKAMDISAQMIQEAKNKFNDEGIEFLVADAEEVSPDAKFDMITSNACFQWFQDPAKALARYARKLEEGGLFLFSIFGPKTFWELGAVWEDFFKDRRVAASRFMTKEKLSVLLRKNFKDVSVDEVRYNEKFDSLFDLLSKIKYTGVSGEAVLPRVFLGSQRLKKLERSYRQRFGHIQATYQVFFCHCRKP